MTRSARLRSITSTVATPPVPLCERKSETAALVGNVQPGDSTTELDAVLRTVPRVPPTVTRDHTVDGVLVHPLGSAGTAGVLFSML